MESTLDPKVFRKITSLVYDTAGIKLGPHKEALVCARVGKRMRQLGISRFEDYWTRVEEDATGAELVELLNVISTNVTHFFREPRHFELLGDLLKTWEAGGQTRFRIWSAASSTGEEPYSIAITAKERLRDTRDMRILATDLSTRVLAAAKAGEYTAKHLETMPKPYIAKYFRVQRDGEEGTRYPVAEAVRQLVTFSRLNLSRPPFPMKGPFDVIFCRNVMIYFDNEVRKRLLAELYRLIRPGGYLMVGHAESLSGMLSSFKSLEPSVFVRA